MNRGKWIIAGILIVGVFFLIRDGFLSACGLDLSKNAKANFFLAAAVAGFIIVGLLVAKKYKGWASLFPIICLITLLTIGISSCITSCNENKEKKRNTLTERANEEAVRILTGMVVNQTTKELGLSQKKSSSKNQGNRVDILPPGQKPKKKIKKKKPTDSNWGYKVATQDYRQKKK